MIKWDYKEEWHQKGKDFLIVVKRHSVTPSTYLSQEEGPHRWAVYAYIYPSHRLFVNFNGPDMWQPAACFLPLHGGVSFLHWHRDDDGKPTSVQVGADYNHLHDEHYSYCATPEEAHNVFQDRKSTRLNSSHG